MENTETQVVAVVRSRVGRGEEHIIFASRGQIIEARVWADDCMWAEESLDGLSDQQIVRGVDRHYDGGWSQFIADGAF